MSISEMSAPQVSEQQKIRKQFVDIAHELSTKFPDLDLRFNLRSGSATLRYMAASLSSEIHELPLGEQATRDLLHEAIFTIKELAQIFDA